MARPSKISVATVKRNQRFRGPGLSAQQNDMQDELIRDITEIQFQHNNFMVPLLGTLPDGSDDSTVDAFRNGLDGQTLYVHSDAVNSAALTRYYNNVQGRPNTAFEQFQDVYNYVDSAIETVEESVSGSTSGSGLTTSQKERIGLNVFDTSLTSSPTSIDGKTDKNELNIVQIARDLYGSSFVSFTVDGSGILTNSTRTMVDALLELHSGNWDDDATLSHSIDASEITGGTFLQTRVGPSSGTGTGVNDSYVGSPADTVDDLNQIRTLLKDAKGTVAFTTAIAPDGTWAAVTPQPDSFTDLISLGGTGTRSNNNPWGYDYTDIDQLSNIVAAEIAYTGRATALDNSTSYSATTAGFSNGDPLVDAIGALASELNSTTTTANTTSSGLNTHTADLSNPHEVTLTQAAAQGGSAPASQVTIVDSGAIYTSANVEDALQEIHSLAESANTTLSGSLKSYIDSQDTTIDNRLTTVSGELQNQISANDSDILDAQTSTAFRRSQQSINLAPAAGVALNHSAGMYPQVQIINENGAPNPWVEPISVTSGVWIEHTDTDNIYVTNYTGITVSGYAVINW
jgi:hypothetical protein